MPRLRIAVLGSLGKVRLSELMQAASAAGARKIEDGDEMNASQLSKIRAALMQGVAKLSDRDGQRSGRWLRGMSMDHHRVNKVTGAIERERFKRPAGMSARQFKIKSKAHRRALSEGQAAKDVLGVSAIPKGLGPKRERRVMRQMMIPDFRYFKGRPGDKRARGMQ